MLTDSSRTGVLTPIITARGEGHPMRLYLATLTQSSRISMEVRLTLVARLFGYADPYQYPWAEMRYEHAVAVRAHYLELGRAPATTNGMLCSITGVARQAWSLGLMGAEDYHRLRSIPRARGSRLPPGRALTPGEIERLFEACAADMRPKGARDAGIIGVMSGGGLRRFEVPRLDLASYDPDARALMVLGKGNKERCVYLAEGAVEAVEEWLYVRGNVPGPLFYGVETYGRIAEPRHRMSACAIEDAVEKRAAQAGVTRFSTHDLRRTYISNLLDSSGDLLAVQELVGHADPKTTKKYDRRGTRAMVKAVATIEIPFHSRRKPRLSLVCG